MKYYLAWAIGKPARVVKRARRMRRHWFGPFDTAAAAVRYGKYNGYRNIKLEGAT